MKNPRSETAVTRAIALVFASIMMIMLFMVIMIVMFALWQGILWMSPIS